MNVHKCVCIYASVTVKRQSVTKHKGPGKPNHLAAFG